MWLIWMLIGAALGFVGALVWERIAPNKVDKFVAKHEAEIKESLVKKGVLKAVAVFGVACMLASLAAQATNTPPPAEKPVANANANAYAGAKSHADADATATQSQTVTVTPTANGGAGGAGGAADANASQEQSAYSGDVSNDISYSSSYTERRQAPSISAPTVYASGSCSYGWSVGLSLPGGGASGGKSTPDKDCNRRELARMVAPLNPWLALKVLCEDPIIVEMRLRNLSSELDCEYVPPKPTVAAATPVEPPKAEREYKDYVTRPEMEEVIRRSLSK